MSGKLDQSLDEILSTRRQSARRGGGRGRRVPNTTRPNATTFATTVGGVKKNTKLAKGGNKGVVPSGPAGVSGDSKIIVSNLVCLAASDDYPRVPANEFVKPPDVNESQIKVC